MPSIIEADIRDVPLRCVIARSRRSCHSYGSKSMGSIRPFVVCKWNKNQGKWKDGSESTDRQISEGVRDKPSGEEIDILAPGAVFLRAEPLAPFFPTPLLEEDAADGSWASALALGPKGPPSIRVITECAKSSPAARSAISERARGSEDTMRAPSIASSW
jgi:hypothetical protein